MPKLNKGVALRLRLCFIKKQFRMINKKYLDVQELSEYISSTKSSIYSKKCRNQIPHKKIGRRLIFDRETIDEWISNGGKLISKVQIPQIKV